MKKIKLIEKILLNKGITGYKVIEENLFQIRYKIISESTNFDEIVLKNIYIYFDFEKHGFKLLINEEASDQSVEELITESLKLCKAKIDKKIQDNILSKKVTNSFELYSADSCTEIIERNAQNTFKKIDIKMNASYGFEVYNYKMLTEEKIYNQQFIHSDYFFYKSDDPSINAYVSLNNNFETPISDLIYKQFNISKLQKKEIDLSKNILFKSNVASELINQYISCFYASNIYANNSFIKKHEISKKIFDFKFDLISLPFEGMVFDPEGFFTKELYLIKDNKLQNVLCNRFFSKLLNIESTGNSGFFDHNSIAHQNIKVFPRCSFKNENLKSNLTINFIKICSFDPITTVLFAWVVFSENGNEYQSELSINLNSVFEKSIFDSCSHHYNSIECGDMFFAPEK